MTDTGPDELTRRVIAAIAEVRGVSPDGIRPDSTLEELGVDSLDGVNIAFALEEEFDIEIPDEAVYAFTNVRQIRDELSDLLASPSNET
jgi:acyl carrier protein